MFDCVGSDQRTARRAAHGYVFNHIPFVADHSAVMQAYDMMDEGWNADKQRRRTTQKPIGWQLKEECAEDWTMDINTKIQEWNPSWKYHDLVNSMMHTKKYGTTRTQRRGRMRPDETMTERKLRGELRTARTQQQRTKVRRRLWQSRRAI